MKSQCDPFSSCGLSKWQVLGLLVMDANEGSLEECLDIRG